MVGKLEHWLENAWTPHLNISCNFLNGESKKFLSIPRKIQLLSWYENKMQKEFGRSKDKDVLRMRKILIFVFANV